MLDICRVIPRRTAASACLSSWRKVFQIGLNRHAGYDHELEMGHGRFRSRLAFESARPHYRLSLCGDYDYHHSTNATEEQIERIVARVSEFGLDPQINRGAARVIINVIGPEDLVQRKTSQPPCPESRPLSRCCGRTNWPPPNCAANHRRLRFATVRVGGQENIALISGPCSVESREQILSIARSVKKSGAKLLRGGAFKPRTSPYSFQGLREDGLRFLARRAMKPVCRSSPKSWMRAICRSSNDTRIACRSARATCRTFPSSRKLGAAIFRFYSSEVSARRSAN